MQPGQRGVQYCMIIRVVEITTDEIDNKALASAYSNTADWKGGSGQLLCEASGVAGREGVEGLVNQLVDQLWVNSAVLRISLELHCTA